MSQALSFKKLHVLLNNYTKFKDIIIIIVDEFYENIKQIYN